MSGPGPSEERQHTQLGEVEQSEERCVNISLPNRPELWGLARMAVATIASMLGYDFEAIEDLRLAVDELCIACAQGASPEGTVHLSCNWSDTGVYLECTVSSVTSELAAVNENPELEGLSQQELSESILSALVDGYGISTVDKGSRTGWLRKSFPASP